MVEIRTKESEDEYRIIAAASSIPKGFALTGRSYDAGTVYLLSDKGEKKSSGSYYTPNNIVDYIVTNTIGPLCDKINKDLYVEISTVEAQLKVASDKNRAELESQLTHLKQQFAERVLTIRILDPAMGSGHFLIRACQYVAEQIATNPHTHDTAADDLKGDESVLTYWKRRVAESCLYGVDRNFMAVELAKLALWLETIATSLPLTFLDHHLRHGDSLVGASFSDLRSLPDAPPMFEKVFAEYLHSTMPELLATLSQIRVLPSIDVRQVKQKSKLFNKCEVVRKPFHALADSWCSTFFLENGKRLALEEYGALVERLTKPRSFDELLRGEKYQHALQVSRNEAVPFHWQLEFPEVFYSPSGWRNDAGFDVVIGNPPYDVLSEKETGKSLASLKEYLKYSDTYRPSFVGKNNLYKLFVCRSLSLLAEGGMLGFITPMPLLGDEQEVGIRKAILSAGTFAAIEAFPQKDNPLKRVFRDAKLSTAITVTHRTSIDEMRSKPFVSRVHPANAIVNDSPSLKLTAADISLYDPSNLTVVSCSQEDWDLAVRIMQSGRFQRLGSACTSYQGEVNETTDSDFLSPHEKDGELVLRGSNVTMYALREASQGEDLYLDGQRFVKSKGPHSKAQHSREPRIGFQRSSPQNNFRRIVSCPIPTGHFCFDTVSYVPYSECRIPTPLLLALLNSKLLDWYFRLGSTNSKVNEYQFNNLPCPVFSANAEMKHRPQLMRYVQEQRLGDAFDLLVPAMKTAPFSRGVADVVALAAARIIEIETARGEISRRDRAALAPEAQDYQNFIDGVLFTLAGIDESEAVGLDKRLGAMM